MAFANRVTQLLGVDIPILQAPMGFIAKPTLVAAVSEAGAMGLVPGSLGIDEVRADVRRTRELTDKPFGVNLPLAFVKDPAIVDMIVEEGIRFVTTSSGSPTAHTPRLKEAGLTVFHVVPSLRGARKAIEAGVDGLVVEGSEGAGFKAPREVSSMVLLPLVASQVGVPVIAAGGIADGRSMAAAFALGAEGVQMGTRMVATRESPVHDAMKNAVVAADETATMLIGKHTGKQVRVLRTEATAPFELAVEGDPFALLGDIQKLYRDGDLDAGLAQLGQVAGRIEQIEPVAEIIRRTVAEFEDTCASLARRHLAG
ncbi:nitronate monooxygenase family protein [Pseudonocardia sp. WMMC193]|uniref:NAD(P)H-dependent flavin oxidoreductase n=1 Tax=Pseudonocardia sp. WMMC193 TaxID=2911965 RepID=UPI001F1927A1|nr:nitronate monooxygenase [Pseudonocardia sp. WMMC193]MCF7550238.1 nitronate monooxygenase [Pseudonocardia sp. WMMC193]